MNDLSHFNGVDIVRKTTLFFRQGKLNLKAAIPVGAQIRQAPDRDETPASCNVAILYGPPSPPRAPAAAAANTTAEILPKVGVIDFVGPSSMAEPVRYRLSELREFMIAATLSTPSALDSLELEFVNF